MIATWVVNAQTGGWGEGDNKAPAKPSDFFSHLEEVERRQTPEEQIAIWKAMGARDLRETAE